MSETETETPPTTNPDAAELAALRKEKADRAEAERKAKDDELESLRKDKADRDAKDAKKVTAPPVKEAETPPAKTTEKETPPVAKKGSRVSRKWFGDAADD